MADDPEFTEVKTTAELIDVLRRYDPESLPAVSIGSREKSVWCVSTDDDGAPVIEGD